VSFQWHYFLMVYTNPLMAEFMAPRAAERRR
jgi:hypothetical protein